VKQFWILLPILLISILACPMIAYADDGDSGVDVDIGIVSGGDVDVDMDVSAGGDLDISINGEGLATADDVARVAASIPRGGSGISGGSYEAWRFQFIKYLSERFPQIENSLGMTMEATSKLIRVSNEQNSEMLSQKYRQQADVIALSDEIADHNARLQEIEHHRLSEMRAETRSQLEVEHQVVMDYIDYRIALIQYNYNILLGGLLLMVLGLATALGVISFRRRAS